MSANNYMTINAINNKVSRIVHPISSKGKSLCNVGSSLDSSVVDHLHLGTKDILREAFIIITITISSSPPSQESEKAKQNSSAYKTFWILLLTRWRGHGSKWFWCFLYSENFANGRNQNWLTFGPTASLMAGRTLIVAGLRQRLICTCVWGLQSIHIRSRCPKRGFFLIWVPFS